MTTPDATTVEPKTEIPESNNLSTETPSAEAQPKSQGTETPPRVYTEAEYKGLQTVIGNRDQTIIKLTQKIEQLEAEKAELLANHGSAVNEKTILDTALTETKEKASQLEAENAELLKKVDFQKIVMKDYAELTPFIDLFTNIGNEEELREKAKELQGALGQYVNKGVNTLLSGSSPPLEPVSEGTTQGVDPVDAAYRKAVALAGDPSRRTEYEEAYQAYIDLDEQRKKQP